MIHKDTGELVSDRLGQKRRAHRAVHASAERQEDPALSHLFPDLTDRGVLVVRHAPGTAGPTYLIQEVMEHPRAVFRMADLRMKLNAVKPPYLVRDCHMGAGGGMGRQPESGRNARHIVAMAHPGDALLREPLKNGTGPVIPRYGFPVLSGGILLRRRHLAAQHLGQQLTAVADAKDRDPQFKDRRIHLGRSRFIYAVRTPGKDDPDGGKRADLLQRHGVWVDLAVDVTFAHPPGDQLIVLTAEIQDQYAFHLVSSLSIHVIQFARSLLKAGICLAGAAWAPQQTAS